MYEFREVKRMDVLPVDVNEPVEKSLLALRCEELNVTLTKIRTHKWHGTLRVYDTRGIQIASADATYGVIPRIKIYYVEGLTKLVTPLVVVFERSELNKNVIMGKAEHV